MILANEHRVSTIPMYELSTGFFRLFSRIACDDSKVSDKCCSAVSRIPMRFRIARSKKLPIASSDRYGLHSENPEKR